MFFLLSPVLDVYFGSSQKIICLTVLRMRLRGFLFVQFIPYLVSHSGSYAALVALAGLFGTVSSESDSKARGPGFITQSNHILLSPRPPSAD